MGIRECKEGGHLENKGEWNCERKGGWIEVIEKMREGEESRRKERNNVFFFRPPKNHAPVFQLHPKKGKIPFLDS